MFRYQDYTNIGGFLWWTLIKFGRTDLKQEQTKDKKIRNFLFLLVLIYFGVFFAFLIFNNL